MFLSSVFSSAAAAAALVCAAAAAAAGRDQPEVRLQGSILSGHALLSLTVLLLCLSSVVVVCERVRVRERVRYERERVRCIRERVPGLICAASPHVPVAALGVAVICWGTWRLCRRAFPPTICQDPPFPGSSTGVGDLPREEAPVAP